MTRERPLRLLYSFPHPLGGPGIGTTAMQQVRGLAELGVRVTVYCTSLEAAMPPQVDVIETMRVFGKRVPHRTLGADRTYAYHDGRVARELARRQASQGEPFDVVHAWPLGALDTLNVAKSLGIPAFREVPNSHTANAYEQATREWELVGVEPPRGHSHNPSGQRLVREEAEYAAGLLLVPSDHVAETFVDRGVARERLRRHQYGYDPSSFSPAGTADMPDRGITMLFVGSAEPRKGLHYALRAWVDSGAAERGRFVICGSYVPGYREFLRPWLAHPSIEERGFSDDVAEVMREAHVLVLPSVEEGSALVTYEAQGSGCALLVSDAAGAQLQEGVSGLVHKARDLDALTNHMRRLVAEPELLQALRLGARTAASGLTWAAAGRRLLSIYHGSP